MSMGRPAYGSPGNLRTPPPGYTPPPLEGRPAYGSPGNLRTPPPPPPYDPTQDNLAAAKKNQQYQDYGISSMLSDQEPLLESSLKNNLAASDNYAPNTLTAGLSRLRTGLARTGLQAHLDAATNYGQASIGIRQHGQDQAQAYDLAMKSIAAEKDAAARLAMEREQQRQQALYGDVFKGAATVLPWLIPGMQPLAAANTAYQLYNPGSPAG